MTAEALFRILSFRFAEKRVLIVHLHRPARLLRCRACGMIAATALAKSNNQAAIRVRRDKGGLFP
jgi:hypothetical protein